MSLAIDIDRVQNVLLSDGWHSVEGNSFEVDAYEYIRQGDQARLLGGHDAHIPATGFMFQEKVNGREVVTCGPLTAVLAVRYPRK